MNKTNSAPTESSSPPRKRKWLRRLLYVVLVLIVLVLAATFVGPWAASGYVKGAIIQQIKADTGCDAAIDSLKLSLWSSRKAELAGLVIQSPDGFGGEPLLKIDRATVDASLWGALSGKLDINVAAGVDVYLVRSESGAYNFDALAAQQPAPPARPAPPKAPAPQGPRKPLPAYALHLRTNIEPINIHVIDLKENRRETSAGHKILADVNVNLKDLSGRIATLDVSLPGVTADGTGGFTSLLQPNPNAQNMKLNVHAATEQLAKLLSTLAYQLPVEGSATFKLESVPGNERALRAIVDATANRLTLPGKANAEPLVLTGLKIDQALSFDLDTKDIALENFAVKFPGSTLTADGTIRNALDEPVFDLTFHTTADAEAPIFKSLLPESAVVRSKAHSTVRFTGSAPDGLRVAIEARLEDNYLRDPAWPAAAAITDKLIEVDLDATYAYQTKTLKIDKADVRSSFLSLDSSGEVEQLDLLQQQFDAIPLARINATVNADLARMGLVLSTLGLLPQNVEFGGQLESTIASSGDASNFASTGATTIKNFTVHDRQTGLSMAEPAIQINHDLRMPLADNTPQGIDVQRLAVTTTALLNGQLTGKVTGPLDSPDAAVDLNGAFSADLEKIGAVLAGVGALPAGTALGGSARGSAAIVGPFKQINVDLQGQVKDLAASGPLFTRPIREPQANVTLNVSGNAFDLSEFDIQRAQITLDSGEIAARGTASAQSIDLTSEVDLNLAKATEQFGGLLPLAAGSHFDGRLRSELAIKGAWSALQVAGTHSIQSLRTWGGPVGANPVDLGSIDLAHDVRIDTTNGTIDLGKNGVTLNSDFASAAIKGIVHQAGQVDVKGEARLLALDKIASLARAAVGSVPADLKMASTAALSFHAAGTTDSLSGGLSFDAKPAALSLGTPQFSKASGEPMDVSVEARKLNVSRFLAELKASPTGPFPSLDGIMLNASAGKITYEQMPCDSAKLKAEMKGGIVTFTELDLKPLGGTVTSAAGATQIDFTGKEPAIRSTLQARDVLVGKVALKYLREKMPILTLPIGDLTGKTNLDLTLTASGASSERILQTLQASGEMTSPAGIDVAFDWLRKIPAVTRFISQDLAALSYKFHIKDQTLFAEPFAIERPRERLSLTGTTDLQTLKVDYAAALWLKGGFPKELQPLADDEGYVHFKLAGTVANPKPNLEDLLRRYIEEKLKEEVPELDAAKEIFDILRKGGQKDDKPDEEEKKPIENILDGLLKRQLEKNR